ncbi:DUF2975 domain-containing protein [Streptococcus orisasini]|uniref:DUF2975 domain-containing protein n=1 Tax=Streptococcus orisasini TaxID=1080071 RepID=UPI00070ABCB7|nr:DUF2975 domain-containing protein [Streptococcus orisasini]
MENSNIIKMARGIVKALSILTLLLAGITALTGVLALIFKEPVLDFLMKFVDKKEGVIISAKGLSFMSTEEVLIKTTLLVVSLFVLYYIFRLVRRLLDNLLVDKVFVIENVDLVKRTSYVVALYSLLPVTSQTGVTLNVNITMLIMAFIVWIFSQVLAKANAIAEENEFTI